MNAERIVLGIEYDGSNYHGWQRQTHAASVQSSLEATLSQVADQPIGVVCAGRTDTGVHATAQVIHFDCTNVRPERAWIKGANSLLPPTISIRYAKAVSDQFHARFSATSRSYIYIIDNSAVKPAIMNQGLTWYNRDLDVSLMNEAASYFIGEHDFSSFRSSRCQSNSAKRCMTNLTCKRFDNFVIFEITANAFLHHMVRNIVGTLMEIGEGRKPSNWAKVILEAKDRRQAGVTAAPNGLYLAGVSYPEEFGLPFSYRAPLFLQQLNTNK